MALSSARSRAFTLVELLVVIGIIAVLISILLPVMGRARESANNVKCMSNLRTIGQAMAGYQAENKGSLPWGFIWNRINLTTGASAQSPAYIYMWSTLLNKYMNPKTPNAGLWSRGEFGEYFKCPSVDQSIYRQSVQYGFHSVAMPSLPYEIAGDGSMYTRRDAKYPLIKPATSSDLYPDTALVWDTFCNAKFSPESNYFDFAWRYSFIDGGQLLDGGNPWLRYRSPGKDHYSGVAGLQQNEPIFLGNPTEFPEGFEDDADIGAYYWNYHYGAARFRHFKNSSANVVFADGSVQSKRVSLSKIIPGTAGGTWTNGGVVNELMRSQIMLKWPTSMVGPPADSSGWQP